jgi:hypothetical protein
MRVLIRQKVTLYTHLIASRNTTKSLARQEKSKIQTMKPDSSGGQEKLIKTQ